MRPGALQVGAIAAAALWMGASACHAEDGGWSGFALVNSVSRDVNESLNTGNRSAVPRRQLEAAMVADFEHSGFTARLRLERIHSEIDGSAAGLPRTENKDRLIALRAAKTFSLAGGAALTAGKINLHFDEGHFFHPLDFLEDSVQTTDFEDRLGRSEGFPLVALAAPIGGWETKFIVSDDSRYHSKDLYLSNNNGFNRGQRQWIAAMRRSFGDTHVTALAQQYERARPGGGGAFTHVVGAETELYGAWFASRGTRYPIHKNVFEGRGDSLGPQDVYLATSPVQAWRSDENRLFRRWILGSSITLESGLGLILEWAHDDRGMDRGESRIWEKVVAFHERLPEPIRSINLAYDASALRYRRADYLFGQVSQSFESWKATASMAIGTDRSRTSTGRLEYRLRENLEFWAELTKRDGGTLTEFASLAERRTLSLGAKFYFQP